MYPSQQGQAGQLKNNPPTFLGGVAAVLALVGMVGITGCTVQLEDPATRSTGNIPPVNATPSNSSTVPGSGAITSVVQKFINSVNTGNQAGAYDLLCPRSAAEGGSKVQEATAGSAKFEMDHNNPPKILQTQAEVGIVGTVNGDKVKGSVIGSLETNKKICVMYFGFYESS